MRKICIPYVSLCLLAACRIGATASICTASQPVVIGAPIPLSGQLKAFGQMMKNAFEMAAEDINLAGGIHSRSVELRFADDQGDAAMVDAAFRHMASARPVMLVGGHASDATYRMARMAESRDVPFLVCTASADKITQRGWTNIYRLNPPISEYTQGLEDFWVKNLKPKSMLILFEDSMFGTGGSFHKKYAQRFGHKTDYHGAEAYSALMVAAEALRRAKSFEPENIRQALNSIYMKTPFGPVKYYFYGYGQERPRRFCRRSSWVQCGKALPPLPGAVIECPVINNFSET